MKIGIIGDTHDQVPELKTAIQALKKEDVELLIHAGDWVSAFTLVYYKPITCPIKGVWGNNVGDNRFPALARQNDIDVQIEEKLTLELDGKKIFVCHELDAPRPDVDVVIYGHDHVAKIANRRGVLYINPGTLLKETFPWLKSVPSYALYETTSDKAQLNYLNIN